jgi:hypothetical protein
MKTLTNQWYQELRAESEGVDEEEQMCIALNDDNTESEGDDEEEQKRIALNADNADARPGCLSSVQRWLDTNASYLQLV